jgi:MAF protein
LKTLVLASTSPRRRELLAGLGVTFRVEAADVDEAIRAGERPVETARRLALAKARAVAARLGEATDGLVIGADTVVAMGSRVLGKPASPAEATAMLRELRGKTHRVITGVAIVDPATGRSAVGSETTRVRMRHMTDAEIAAYVASGDPFDKAGGYAIQNRAFHPVESIDGCYNNVVGLPLCCLVKVLRAFGVELPDPR